MVESALMNVVVRVLMVPDDTPRVINLPATSSNVELIKIVLTTIRSRFRLLVQYCLESGPMVKTLIKEPSALDVSEDYVIEVRHVLSTATLFYCGRNTT